MRITQNPKETAIFFKNSILNCRVGDTGFDMYNYKTGHSEKCPVLDIQALFSVFVRRSTEELLENTDEVFIGKIAALFCDG